MISIWFSLLLPILGGLFFRIRGGWLGLSSTTLGRAVWAVGMSIIPALIDWRLALLAPALFLGCVLPWWKSIDMARNEGVWITDFLMHTLRGVLWVLPAAAMAFWPLRWWSLLILVPGFLCGALYELGWRTPSKIPHFNRGAEVGEVYFGAVIGAGIALSIILANLI